MTRLCLAAEKLQRVQMHVREGIVVLGNGCLEKAVPKGATLFPTRADRRGLGRDDSIDGLGRQIYRSLCDRRGHPKEVGGREAIAAGGAAGFGQHGAKQWGHPAASMSGGGGAFKNTGPTPPSIARCHHSRLWS